MTKKQKWKINTKRIEKTYENKEYKRVVTTLLPKAIVFEISTTRYRAKISQLYKSKYITNI